MRPPRFRILPRWHNALLALLGAGLLILAFPDFEWWWTAWFALVPLMWAIEREGKAMPSFMLGWLFGTTYFFGTCWWLTYAPIHYAAVPPWLAYLLVITACILAGLFPGLFAAILARLLKRFGAWAYFAAPFVWVFTEFARYWLTGNNWNALAYSQALAITHIEYGGWLAILSQTAVDMARFGGVALVSFLGLIANSVMAAMLIVRSLKSALIGLAVVVVSILVFFVSFMESVPDSAHDDRSAATVVAIQPNVPMAGLDGEKWRSFRRLQFEMALSGIHQRTEQYSPPIYEPQVIKAGLPVVAILPESPMNFAYNDDREFQRYVREFTTKNKVSLLFNSAEPDRETGKYFNSAVMVGPDGNKIAQYDKLYLLPFGEAVPFPFEGLMPPVVGSFAYGKNYSLVPVGDAKAGVMICFESHFGQLGREQVKQGADVIIEMTNDGYLGPTPVLRQHLANAVFRAVETNRPVLRVTNVGITAYINERGAVLDAAPTYTEATRVWSVSKSDGSQTFYVKYGDWFAWLCTVVAIVLLLFSFRKKKALSAISA